jgi:uncharacterized protein (TIGR04255 family)
MTLSLPTHPRRLYDQNPLKLVVCQVRFPVLTRFEEPSFPAPFQEALSERYPRSALQHELGVTLGPAGAATVPSPPAAWRFSDLEDQWTVVLARDFVSLETTAYEQFERFKERLQEVLGAVEALGVKARERLGLRYVDEIRHPGAVTPADWREYLNEKLLGMVGGEELGDDVIHTIQEIRLREDDGTLVIRHGYIGREPTDGNPFYLLDTDYYDDRPQRFDVPQIMEQLDTYHETIHNIFEESITDRLREHLGVKEEIRA